MLNSSLLLNVMPMEKVTYVVSTYVSWKSYTGYYVTSVRQPQKVNTMGQ